MNTKQISCGILILIALCIYALIFYFFLRKKEQQKNIKTENLFLIVASVFCTLFMLAVPMSNGHDETIHAMRIYEYSEGKIISDGQKAYLEEGVINSITNKSTYSDIIKSDKTYSTKTDTISYGYRIASYSPVNYLPQIIGISIGRIFTNNSMVHLYLARLCNIISCVAIIYFAIKIIPFGKNLLFVLSCIPITIEGFSTLSADGLLVASSFFWISYILYLCSTKDKKVGKKEILILLLNAIVIALSKTIYIVLLLLLLLIPKEKWNSRKQRIIVIISIILISAILDVGWYFVGIQKSPLSNGKSAISYIFKEPIKYGQKVLYTIFNKSSKYILEIYGSTIEWNEQITIHLFPFLLLFSSIAVSIMGKEKIEWKNYQKIILILTILACVTLVFTSMFLAWPKTNIKEIEGVQGRYFMPILPLVFLLLGRKFLDTQKATNKIAILIVIMQIYVITQLVIWHI